MTENPLRAKGFVPGDYSADNYKKIDLHRPYVDHIVLVGESGKPMHRETDLIDVWFDSGAMPFAQQHYPFEHKEGVDSGELFPADFIAEGVDQTRGWFFTLHAIAGMVKDSVAYKAVISNGLVLDKFGNKMSKRLGNAVDPFSTIEEHGSDPLRWYMISNSAPWDNLKFDEQGIREVSRKFFGTLFNTYSFLARYANVDGFDPTSTPSDPCGETPGNRPLDHIPAQHTHCRRPVGPRRLRAYGCRTSHQRLRSGQPIQLVCAPERARFWSKGLEEDKIAAYQTLYECLETVALLMAR